MYVYVLEHTGVSVYTHSHITTIAYCIYIICYYLLSVTIMTIYIYIYTHGMSARHQPAKNPAVCDLKVFNDT